MFCISTASIQVLWNGVPTKKFFPSKGVCQGEPISPYLFVLCIERLGQSICFHVRVRNWNPMELSTIGPIHSYLSFVDYLLLFAKAN